MPSIPARTLYLDFQSAVSCFSHYGTKKLPGIVKLGFGGIPATSPADLLRLHCGLVVLHQYGSVAENDISEGKLLLRRHSEDNLMADYFGTLVLIGT
ncbi:hypothetical protein ACSYAD_25020 [Acaryochloris marina NIES-2412]|uniref:hypothetical protein n=1 Tax=Acaryochloris marina TaxID=155978 RepID=UPI004058EC53